MKFEFEWMLKRLKKAYNIVDGVSLGSVGDQLGRIFLIPSDDTFSGDQLVTFVWIVIFTCSPVKVSTSGLEIYTYLIWVINQFVNR